MTVELFPEAAALIRTPLQHRPLHLTLSAACKHAWQADFFLVDFNNEWGHESENRGSDRPSPIMGCRGGCVAPKIFSFFRLQLMW